MLLTTQTIELILGDWPELDEVTGFQQEGVCDILPIDSHRCSTNQLPSAWCRSGINAGLAIRDPN